MPNELLTIRKFEANDKAAIVRILNDTNVFSSEEVNIAIELMDEFLNNPEQRDYDLYTATDESQQALGYYCVGPTPLTIGTFDLYWIAVDPMKHDRGVGRMLIRHCEELIKSQGGRLLVAETSSMPHYEHTRRFYLSQGYEEVSKIKNYYKPGDDLIIYGKYV